jgi:hypothetical protein
MRNFEKLAEGVQVGELLHAITVHPELWNQKRFRTTFDNTPHAEVDDIWVRFSDDGLVDDKSDTARVMADGACVWHPAAKILPVKGLLLGVMGKLGAYELNRVVITRLAPGRRILPHADNKGAYVSDPDRQRYHLVLQGLPGSLYRTESETVNMRTGELWWFNALLEHEVVNNSVDDRIHMLMDVRLFP